MARVAILVLALVWSAAASAADLRLDNDGFTADVRQLIQDAVPGAEVVAAAPLTVTIKMPGGTAFSALLNRLHDYCVRVEGDCRDQVQTFVRAAVQGVAPAYDGAMLRAVLRPQEYLDDVRARIPDKPASFFLSRPFAGELVEMCMIDRPDTALLLNADMLAKMQLTADAAFARCEANLTPLEKLPDVPDVAGRHVGVGAGDYYYSSLLLLHDAWKPLVQRFGGKLLVAVPEPNTIVYMDSDDPQALAIMRHAVQVGLQGAERQLSGDIYRWTPAGWELVAP